MGLSLLCGIQGLATIALDLNRTHATNPAWTRHARYHVVWQTFTVALESLVELGLLWSGLIDPALGFYLALLLASLSPIAFLLAFGFKRTFDGALYDPNGIQPLRLPIGGRVIELDGNMVAVVAALIALAVILGLYRH